MSTRALRTALVAGTAATLLMLGSLPAFAQATGDATIEVSKTEVMPGETITITNTPGDASTCQGGMIVIFVDGAPIAVGWNQLIVEPDEDGNWSTTWTTPIPEEWPSQAVGGPFLFAASCIADETAEEAAALAQPVFDYDPVTVTVLADVPTTSTSTTAAPAVAAETAPAFTG